MTELALTKEYKPYKKYKNSEVEWLGNIPESWAIVPVKALFKRAKRTGFSDEKLLSVYRDYGVIEKSSRDDNHNKASDDLSPYQLVQKDDLVTNKMKAWQGSIAISQLQGIVSPAYHIYKPLKKNSSRYLHYLVRSDRYIAHYVNISTGVRNNQWDLDPMQFKNMQILVPSVAEQEKIADFLDEKMVMIDSIIEKKKIMIERLKEKRSAIINHAVTKGLDPKAELKDSGVEWIGKVNKDFKLIKLRYLTKVSTGSKDTVNADPDGKYPFFVRSPKIENIGSYTFDGEAVLTAGDGAGVGKVFHYFNGKLDYHQRVYLFSSFKKVNGKFFYYYLSSNLFRVVLMGESKSTVDSIRLPQLLGMPFTVPDYETQNQIVDYLDKATKNYEEALSRVSASILKLQEFKSSLISHAVTGKIKI